MRIGAIGIAGGGLAPCFPRGPLHRRHACEPVVRFIERRVIRREFCDRPLYDNCREAFHRFCCDVYWCNWWWPCCRFVWDYGWPCWYYCCWPDYGPCYSYYRVTPRLQELLHWMRTYASSERYIFKSLTLRKSLEDHPYRIIRHGHLVGMIAGAGHASQIAYAESVRPPIRVADHDAEMSIEVGKRLDVLA